jgi:hypothetical protein
MGPRGLTVAATWSELRQQLREAVIDGPPLDIDPTTPDKSMRLRLASNLQKAIRSGAAAQARHSAVMLYRLSPWFALHRAVVCCLEDIGLADAVLTARVLIGARDKGLQAERGEQLAGFLAAKMAASVKDRSVAHLWIIEGPGEPAPDLDLPEIDQLVAGLSETLPPASSFGSCYARTKRLLRNEPAAVVEGRPNLALLGDGMLESSIDMHTEVGARIAGYVSKASRPLGAFFERHPEARKIAAIGLAVFDTEGGQQDRRLSSPLIDDLAERAARVYTQPTGLSWADYQELKEIVASEAPLLARARRRILASPPAQPQKIEAQQGPQLSLPTLHDDKST